MNILKFRLHKIPHITVFLMFRMYHVFYREVPVLSKKNREIFYETVRPEQIGSKTFQAQKTMFFLLSKNWRYSYLFLKHINGNTCP